MNVPHHVPVLPAEVLEALAPAPGQLMADVTVGAGGHAHLLAERLGPGGRLIGLDRDESMLALARPRLEDLPATLVQANFDRLPVVLQELGIPALDGVLADLGVCSDQLDEPERGLSFQQAGPLDMRLDPDTRRAGQRPAAAPERARPGRRHLPVWRGTLQPADRPTHR